MPDNIRIEYFKTPFGELILGSYNDSLCLCDGSLVGYAGGLKTKLKLLYLEKALHKSQLDLFED